MKKYGTLVIGSNFASIGYAMGAENALIVEQTEMLDTSFYLPMVGFEYKEYEPVTEYGRELLGLFLEYGIVKDGRACVNAYEIALSRFAERHGANIYLKCRVIDKKERDGGYVVTLLHNGGLEEIEVGRIIDARPKNKGEKRLTVLFDTVGDADASIVLSAFPGARVTGAFYEGRYAAFIPIWQDDVNDAKVEIYGKWRDIEGLRILYIAPVFHYTDAVYPLFFGAENPIKAYERGLFAAKEGEI